MFDLVVMNSCKDKSDENTLAGAHHVNILVEPSLRIMEVPSVEYFVVISSFWQPKKTYYNKIFHRTHCPLFTCYFEGLWLILEKIVASFGEFFDQI